MQFVSRVLSCPTAMTEHCSDDSNNASCTSLLSATNRCSRRKCISHSIDGAAANARGGGGGISGHLVGCDARIQVLSRSRLLEGKRGYWPSFGATTGKEQQLVRRRGASPDRWMGARDIVMLVT